MQDADARIIINELNFTQKAMMKLLRELESLKAASKHTEELLHATRAEVAEARAILKNAHSKATGGPTTITQLFHTVAYKQPQPVQTFAKDTRIFINEHEAVNGKISHVVRAKDSNGYILNLPCGYDQAHKFMSMEVPNRRRCWKGKRDIYTAMLDLALRVGFIERKGRGYMWCPRFDVWKRLEWLSQFKPPHRVR